MLQIKKETVNTGEYKVGNNANITNFAHLWKTQIDLHWKCFYFKLIFFAIGPALPNIPRTR